MSPVQALGIVVGCSFLLWVFVYRVAKKPLMSGDTWHTRHMAYTREAVSAPYCWRPLLPWLARIFGFHFVTYTATVATPFVIYYYLGGGWSAAAVASMFVGNASIFSYQIRCPEYAEGLGQLLFVSAIWAMSVNSPWAFLLCFLGVLCRENIGAALGAIAVFWNPWLLLPIAAGGALAYFTRRESKTNHHPLVKPSAWATMKHWAGVKDVHLIHWTAIVQPLRGLAFSVPWVWERVSGFPRVALVGFAAIWFFSIPASGVTRHICYGFVLFAPFVHNLESPWLYAFVLLTWFWPFYYLVYDETGTEKFFHAR